MKLERRNGTGEPASPAPEETPSSGSIFSSSSLWPFC